MYLKKNPPLKDGVTIKTTLDRKPPTPLATSLGCCCKYYAPFMADYLDQPTVLNGAKYRFLRKTPQPERRLLEELRMFVRAWVGEHLMPLQRSDVDYDRYLAQTNYTLKKKQKLLEIRANQHAPPLKVTYRSFGKAEFINIAPKFGDTERGFDSHMKNVRCINGPEDRWKVYVAALIHEVEVRVCKDKHFAKYIPVKDRAKVIFDRLSRFPGPYYVTDYTSFEASFTKETIKAVEGELYDFMLQDFEERELLVKQLIGLHYCKYRGFTIKVPATRMSGDSNTSLGNGFTNLMLTSFMAFKSGVEFDGFVEGDDGEFAFSGKPQFHFIDGLGFDLKFSAHDTIYTTSFCGLMLSRSLALFSDPVFEIVKFGWTTAKQRHSRKKKVLLGLLRAKSLSLFYCHPRCPMLTTLALKFIGLTEEVTPIWENSYWEQKIVAETIRYQSYARQENSIGISAEDREDFLRLYGIEPVIQREFERYISSLTAVKELNHWSIDALVTHPSYAWLSANYAK